MGRKKVILFVFSILFVLLLFMGNTLNIVVDARMTLNKSRGMGFIPVQLDRLDKDKIILPGENTSFKLIVYYSAYSSEGDVNITLILDGIPMDWTASLNQTNFTLKPLQEAYFRLNVSSPVNASAGTLAKIIVGGIWENKEYIGQVGKVQTHTFILGSELVFVNNALLVSKNETKEGEEITIEAKVYNFGDINAENISVRFLVDNKQIGKMEKLDILSPGMVNIFTKKWIAKKGNHNLSVEIDPENTIDEYHEENNVAYRSIFVKENPTFPFLSLIIIAACIELLIIIAVKLFRRSKQI